MPGSYIHIVSVSFLLGRRGVDDSTRTTGEFPSKASPASTINSHVIPPPHGAKAPSPNGTWASARGQLLY